MQLVHIEADENGKRTFGAQRQDGSIIEIGEWNEVADLHRATASEHLKEILPVVSRNDPNLIAWLTISDAAIVAIEEYGWPSTSTNGNTIRAAARRGNFITIKDARGRYRISHRSFVVWLESRK